MQMLVVPSNLLHFCFVAGVLGVFWPYCRNYLREKYSHRHWWRRLRVWIFLFLDNHCPHSFSIVHLGPDHFSYKSGLERWPLFHKVPIVVFSRRNIKWMEFDSSWPNNGKSETIVPTSLQRPPCITTSWIKQLHSMDKTMFSIESAGSLQDEGLQTFDVIIWMKMSDFFYWSFQVWKVKPLPKCFKPALFVLARRGQLYWLQKFSSKPFHDEFMTSIASLFLHTLMLTWKTLIPFKVK